MFLGSPRVLVLAALTVFAALLGATPSLDAQACAPNCWTISGRVVGPQQEPIVGADLDLLTLGGVSIPLSGDVTAADGTFSFVIQQTIVSNNYTLQVQPAPGSNYFPGSTVIFLFGSASVGDQALDLGSRFTGRVIDEQGFGIQNVDLNFVPVGSMVPVPFPGDSTAADGTFSVLVTPDIYDVEFRTTLTTPGGPYIPVTLEARPLTSDFDAMDVTFLDGHLLQGTVVEVGTNLPVANADLDIRDPVTGDALETPGDNTDINGNFSFFAPAGAWEIEVDPPLGTSLVALFLNATIQPGVVNTLATIELPQGVTVSGTTVNGATPVPEVDLDFVISVTQVEIATAHDNANSSGVFSVQVEPNTYDIQFRPPFSTGLAPRVLTNQLVNANLSLGPVQLFAGSALTGIVTNGSPIEGVEVTLSDPTTGNPVYTFGNDTDASGAYAIRQLPGIYDVTFTPLLNPGLGTITMPNVDMSNDQVLNIDFGLTDQFLRGDMDLSGMVNIADAILILEFLFLGNPLGMVCPDAIDVNDSGSANIADAVHILAYLFVGGDEPASPFPSVGVDPTADSLPPCP